MGGSTWNADAYRTYSLSTADKSADDIFTHKGGCHKDLDPSLFAVRESCDSDANPNSTPIIIGSDVTGSMGILAEKIIKKGLGVIVEEIRNRNPIPDPHILLAAIGDMTCDQAPLQTTQFEADTVILDQIEKFWIEGHGGANMGESYPALWYFALHKTRCDAIHKRGGKGYLFTIGDERPLPTLEAIHLNKFLNAGLGGQEVIKIEDLLEEVQENWHVFHIITPTSATEHQGAKGRWNELLQQHVAEVHDYNYLGEVIVSIIQANEGTDAEVVAASWEEQEAGLAVRSAMSGMDLVVAGSSSGIPSTRTEGIDVSNVK